MIQFLNTEDLLCREKQYWTNSCIKFQLNTYEGDTQWGWSHDFNNIPLWMDLLIRHQFIITVICHYCLVLLVITGQPCYCVRLVFNITSLTYQVQLQSCNSDHEIDTHNTKDRKVLSIKNPKYSWANRSNIVTRGPPDQCIFGKLNLFTSLNKQILHYLYSCILNKKKG